MCKGGPLYIKSALTSFLEGAALVPSQGLITGSARAALIMTMPPHPPQARFVYCLSWSLLLLISCLLVVVGCCWLRCYAAPPHGQVEGNPKCELMEVACTLRRSARGPRRRTPWQPATEVKAVSERGLEDQRADIGTPAHINARASFGSRVLPLRTHASMTDGGAPEASLMSVLTTQEMSLDTVHGETTFSPLCVHPPHFWQGPLPLAEPALEKVSPALQRSYGHTKDSMHGTWSVEESTQAHTHKVPCVVMLYFVNKRG